MKRNLHLAQQDVYFDQILDLDDPRYNCGGYLSIETRGASMDYDILQTVIKKFYRQHDVFNLEFDFTEPEHPKCSFDGNLRKNDSREPILTLYDYSKRKDAHKEALNLIYEILSKPINLFGQHLAFLYLIKRSKNSFYLVLKFHHIIVDGYSFIPIIASLYNTYISTKCPSKAVSSDKEKALFSENLGSYFNEIQRSEAYEKSKQFSIDQQFWRDTFKDLPDPLFVKKELDKKGFSTISKNIEDDLKTKLLNLSKSSGYSLQKILSTALTIILCRLYRKDRIVIGIPIHGRVGKSQKRIVGMFSKVIPFIGRYKSDMSVSDLLKQISLLQRQTYKYGKYPLTRITRDVRSWGFNNQTLIDLIVNYEPFTGVEIDSEIVDSSLHRVSGGEGSFPLEVVLSDYGIKTPMVLKIDYLNAYFKSEEVAQLLERLIFVVKQIPTALDKRLSDIKLLFPEEEGELLENFNNTQVAYPRDKTVVDLFSEQALRTPGHIAVVCEGASLTYRELDEKSNQLAHDLLSRGVKREELVAICMERSIAMIVGILGIVKSGGAYVPIDPDYPRQRIAYMLEDTASRIVLSTSALQEVVEGYAAVTPIYLDAQQQVLEDYPLSLPDVGLSPHNLAYVIYTSGSTGKPKGVMIEHMGLINLLFSIRNSLAFDHSIRLLSLTTFTFDISILEFFSPLLLGGKLILVSEKNSRDPEQLTIIIKKTKPNCIQATPSRWQMLIDYGWDNKENIGLLSGGEAISQQLKEQLAKLSNKVWNLYGPTETTIWSCIATLEVGQRVTIGGPIANTQIYILGEDLHLQPRGIVGELCISGAGLARGYLNRPDLTAEKFVDNPFQPETRLYRMGTLSF